MKRLVATVFACLAILGSRPTFATEFDAETGLMHMGAREYDPETGRFLQEDPIPTINQYAYARDNPILFSDPTGAYPTGAGVDWWGRPGCSCPFPPQFPQGQNIHDNVCESSHHSNPMWFKGQLWGSGNWDYYHKYGAQYDDAGNFMYGAAAAAYGLTEQGALIWSGTYKKYINNGTYDPSYGWPLGGPPYGNAPAKQAVVAAGWQYGICECQNQ